MCEFPESKWTSALNFSDKRSGGETPKLSFFWLFGHVGCVGSAPEPEPDERLFFHGSKSSRCDSDILRQFSLNISRQKRNKNGSLIFIRRDAIFCRPQNFLGAWTCCRKDGAGGEKRLESGHKAVFIMSKAWMIVYGRIAGLNSPASPPLKKTDTSYNNHALHTHTHTHKKKKNSTETDKMQAGAKHHTDYHKKPHHRVQVTTRAATQKLETLPCHLHQISLLRLLLFFSSSLSHSLSPSLSLSTFCNFWTNRRAADAFFCAQRKHFIAYQRHAPQRRHEKTCTNTLCPDCWYCLASTAII